MRTEKLVRRELVKIYFRKTKVQNQKEIVLKTWNLGPSAGWLNPANVWFSEFCWFHISFHLASHPELLSTPLDAQRKVSMNTLIFALVQWHENLKYSQHGPRTSPSTKNRKVLNPEDVWFSKFCWPPLSSHPASHPELLSTPLGAQRKVSMKAFIFALVLWHGKLKYFKNGPTTSPSTKNRKVLIPENVRFLKSSGKHLEDANHNRIW